VQNRGAAVVVGITHFARAELFPRHASILVNKLPI
jgi:hypothetical protein